jgi:tRNA modification GTPase
MTITDTDTICAIATPPGRSGIGIVRISGPDCQSLATRLLAFSPEPRQAYFTDFHGLDGEVIDRGVALFFRAPHSFTGEDILELQGHGGIFILNSILKAALDMGCRMARPGEFSERSFLNNKMDLTQVEAIADLINANTEQAAKSAFRSLEGAFSRRVNDLVASITQLRVYLEAAIDFTDEDIDFISEGNTVEKLDQIINRTKAVFEQARVGAILQEGINVAIAGRPNAGKSSLLNSLSGRDSAIVTDIPGTTRDTLKELIDVDGIPVHVIDTAGLRASTDVVEQEGVRRARRVIEQADLVLLVLDCHSLMNNDELLEQHFAETHLPEEVLQDGKLLVVFNKKDLLTPGQARNLTALCRPAINGCEIPAVAVSARTGDGVDRLRGELKHLVGFSSSEEGSFSARERHIRALLAAQDFLDSASRQLQGAGNLELVAEDLRQAQNSLGEITGTVTSDDLLGQIFSTFCIGK